MATYTITIDESTIDLETILNDAWRERLNAWSREQTLIEEAEKTGRSDKIAKARRQKFENQMDEISKIINQIQEQ